MSGTRGDAPVHRVYVVSDGSGGTAERVVKAALTQFDGQEVEVVSRPEVRDPDTVADVIHDAEVDGGLVVHTLVSNPLRENLLRAARVHDVDTIDLMGPLLSRLSEQLRLPPAEKPGLFRQLNEEYLRRIETVEFAIRHDDGMRVDEVGDAEIVLVGVSRTFKTPLSVFLAFKGWYVANVAIAPQVPPPAILSTLPRERVFGLTMHARRLAVLRQARHEHLGHATSSYVDLDEVRREVVWALRYFDRHQWPVIDVTGKPIEEIAARLLSRVSHRTDPQPPELPVPPPSS